MNKAIDNSREHNWMFVLGLNVENITAYKGKDK